MERVVIPRRGRRPLEFVGELLAAHETNPNQDSPNYSGSVGYWTSTRVYRTANNCYVLARASHTMWQGERDAFGAIIFGNLEDLVRALEEMSPRAAAAIAADLRMHETI